MLTKIRSIKLLDLLIGLTLFGILFSSLDSRAKEIKCSAVLNSPTDKKIEKNLSSIPLLTMKVFDLNRNDQILRGLIQFKAKIESRSVEEVKKIDFPYYRKQLAKHLPHLRSVLKAHINNPQIKTAFEYTNIENPNISESRSLETHLSKIINEAEKKLRGPVVDVWWFSDFIMDSLYIQKQLRSELIQGQLKTLKAEILPLFISEQNSPQFLKQTKSELRNLLHSGQLPLFTYDLGAKLDHFVKLQNLGIHIIGLSNKLLLEFDGRFDNSLGFAKHDITHTLSFFKSNELGSEESGIAAKATKLFGSFLLKEIENLPINEKRKFGLMWFAFFHERRSGEMPQSTFYKDAISRKKNLRELLISKEVAKRNVGGFPDSVSTFVFSNAIAYKAFELSPNEKHNYREQGRLLNEFFDSTFYPVIERVSLATNQFLRSGS